MERRGSYCSASPAVGQGASPCPQKDAVWIEQKGTSGKRAGESVTVLHHSSVQGGGRSVVPHPSPEAWGEIRRKIPYLWHCSLVTQAVAGLSPARAPCCPVVREMNPCSAAAHSLRSVAPMWSPCLQAPGKELSLLEHAEAREQKQPRHCLPLPRCQLNAVPCSCSTPV